MRMIDRVFPVKSRIILSRYILENKMIFDTITGFKWVIGPQGKDYDETLKWVKKEGLRLPSIGEFESFRGYLMKKEKDINWKWSCETTKLNGDLWLRKNAPKCRVFSAGLKETISIFRCNKADIIGVK